MRYARTILQYLLIGGAVAIAASSPYFWLRFWTQIFKDAPKSKRGPQNAFWYLKKKGLIEIRREGHDLAVRLTGNGRKEAAKYQIDDIAIAKPKKWDGKWRVIIFDIPAVPAASNAIRDVFRKKLKEFGFYQLQKSIWLYPFECEKEIVFLREFLGATPKQVQVLEVSKIENEQYLKNIFHIRGFLCS